MSSTEINRRIDIMTVIVAVTVAFTIANSYSTVVMMKTMDDMISSAEEICYEYYWTSSDGSQFIRSIDSIRQDCLIYDLGDDQSCEFFMEISYEDDNRVMSYNFTMTYDVGIKVSYTTSSTQCARWIEYHQ
jgi:hypothetical protein